MTNTEQRQETRLEKDTHNLKKQITKLLLSFSERNGVKISGNFRNGIVTLNKEKE
jgi:hypothetical protein